MFLKVSAVISFNNLRKLILREKDTFILFKNRKRMWKLKRKNYKRNQASWPPPDQFVYGWVNIFKRKCHPSDEVLSLCQKWFKRSPGRGSLTNRRTEVQLCLVALYPVGTHVPIAKIFIFPFSPTKTSVSLIWLDAIFFLLFGIFFRVFFCNVRVLYIEQ